MDFDEACVGAGGGGASYVAHISSSAVKMVFRFLFGGVGPEIGDFGPLPGPTRPRRGLGKAPAGAPLDLHRFSAW